MAETDDKKVLKMSLICSICLQRLNKPRSLPCFHTFCESCLKNYLVNAPEKKNATKEGIPCPTCKLVTFSPKPALPVEQWSEHFPMNHLVGTLVDIVPVSSRLEFCEPCKDNKESKIARSWCQQCSEALCEECAKCHMSMKATKNHEITPLENVRSNPKPAVKEEVICYEHNKKEVDMYCQDHEQPCCPMCIATNHRTCQKVAQINDVVQKEEPIDNTKLFKDMESLITEADSIKRERQEVMRNTLMQKTKMLQDISDAKKKLIDHIEKIESQITAKFEAITQTDFAIMQEQVDYCNSVQSAMHHSKTAIQSAREQKLIKKEFIVSHQGKVKYNECSGGLKKIHENSAKIKYLFEEDRQVAETLGALGILGKLDIKHSYPNKKPLTPPPPPTPVAEEDDEKKATRKIKTFNAKVKGDKRECKITAIKLWNNKKVLLADNSNVRLKMFGEFGDLLVTFNCSTPPWDLTFIDKAKCAVTFPNERRIRIFKVNEHISEVGYVSASRGCNGICMAGDDLAVTFASGCIRIIALDGAVKMMVDTDYIGKRVFSNPEFIAFNPFSCHLFVSDYNNHTVTALKYENGKVNKTPLFVYKVSGPRGVSVDSRGNLHVCGFWSNDIHKVKDDGQFSQILMDTLARPLCIAFTADGEKFALSEQGNPNSVKLFKIIPASDVEDY
ncbi:tripartite motif-containing protein 2-like [Ruditapes philippinarum]|uniref:tripartite motif-containing protein 2-like n=1 Tax=Ruditapes philippinarum TaxID=129788 RepID=UPI00295AE126|nr:tripartite motif-containing protein 2-like [Ruditapes philippinarum]